jgi:hypothetical protein
MNEGGKEAVRADDQVVAASELRRLEERVRELERLLGRKTMEVEILQEGARPRTDKKTDLAVALAASGRYPVKTVSTTLGVARSNVVERREGKRPRRGAQERAGDVELAGAIRRLVDARRPTGTGGSPRY